MIEFHAAFEKAAVPVRTVWKGQKEKDIMGTAGRAWQSASWALPGEQLRRSKSEGVGSRHGSQSVILSLSLFFGDEWVGGEALLAGHEKKVENLIVNMLHGQIAAASTGYYRENWVVFYCTMIVRVLSQYLGSGRPTLHTTHGPHTPLDSNTSS
jgi:hypothetical protein